MQRPIKAHLQAIRACLPAFGLLLIMLLLAACATSSERRRMEAILDEADSLNRAYASLAGSDSLLALTTRFYDRHGSPNEQMRARYLLGCAYRDLGDAPQALECYQQAIEAADTTATDCDHRLLMSVYGQMAELFHAQNLPPDELYCRNAYQQHALLANDTTEYIRGLELSLKPYFLLGDTERVISTVNKTRELYLQRGDSCMAVNSFGMLIHYSLERNQLKEARCLIQQYEDQSGLFDRDGYIVKERGVYNYLKGLYFVKMHKLDSAENHMRRLLACGLPLDAYRGLLLVYQYRRDADSVFKYAQYFENAVDSYKENLRTQTLHQMSSLYDYQRIQRKAQAERAASARSRLTLALALAASLGVLSVMTWLYVKARKKKHRIQLEYEKRQSFLRQTKDELVLLQKHQEENRELIQAKEHQIALLEKELHAIGQRRDSTLKAAEVKLEALQTCRQFHQMAKKGQMPTDDEWYALLADMAEVVPGFCTFMESNKHLLNQTEFRCCILIRIRMNVKATGCMLGVSSPYISKIRKEMLKTLFNASGTPSDFDKKLLSIG